MYVPLLLYHYDLFILMWSLFLRVLFLEVLFHNMVMWRGVHTPTKYVCGASLSVGVLEQESAEQVQDKLCRPTIGLSMPGKREALGRCWFNVGPRRIDGRPALIRHWFGVSCLLGSLHNFTLFLTKSIQCYVFLIVSKSELTGRNKCNTVMFLI